LPNRIYGVATDLYLLKFYDLIRRNSIQCLSII